MKEYVDKSEVVAEIERLIETNKAFKKTWKWKFKWFYRTIVGRLEVLEGLKIFLSTLEVKDPYEQYVQYDSIKAGIQAHAETYSFNIQSELFNQLTKEQQALWRKEIEQAVISGGDAGYLLAKDPRYKENLEVKEVNIAEMADEYYDALMEESDWMDLDTMGHCRLAYYNGCKDVIKAQKGE